MTSTAEQAKLAKETEAIRLLREGYSPSQVHDRTGVTRERLQQLVRDFPAATPAARVVPVPGPANPAAPLTELPISALLAHPLNIRTDLGDLDGLAATIAEHGILQPLLVTKTHAGPYELLDGHRRLAAARLAGLDRIPIRLHDRVDTTDATVLMLVTGLQKADLHPLDEADAYKRLEDGGMRQAEIADLVGKHPSHVSQRISLAYLNPDERAAFRAKDLGVTEAYQIGRKRNSRRLTVEQKREYARKVPHFTLTHPLAAGAGFLCNRAGHPVPLRLGAACGPCWEDAIRTDAVQKFLEQEQAGA